MKNDDEQISREKNTDSFELLIIANDRKIFIHHDGNREPLQFFRRLFLQHCSSAVIDKESLELIQVLQLHDAIDHTVSSTGSAVLLRSLIQPSTDLHYIRSKQESLEEIAANDELRETLKEYVHEYGRGETALFRFFNKGLHASFPYHDIKKAMHSAANIDRMLPTLPKAESSYLNALISNVQSFRGAPVEEMLRGGIYKTLNGLKSDKEVGLLTPKLKFIPRRFTKWIFAGPAVAAAPHLHGMAGFGQAISPEMSILGLAWTGLHLFYALFIKPVRDTETFIEPLRKKCINDAIFGRAVDAVGMMDELLSCDRFARESPHATILPKVTDGAHHLFESTGLKNPVTAKARTDFVPNHVRMKGARLTFISGPNSGGKTTICKSIVHNQLLAQMGSYVLAEKAVINIADMIRYQAPKFDGLQDDEGRFGTELGRTRDIFYSTGPKSLVILDELAQGTTYEEALHESFEILSDFHTIGNNTVLVTHNHSLVDRFMEEQMGQCLMTEFDGDDPTYRLIPGISRVSHANRIAGKINFSREDRRQYMKGKGYI